MVTCMPFIYRESEFEKVLNETLDRVNSNIGKEFEERYGHLDLETPNALDINGDYIMILRDCETSKNPGEGFATYSRQVNAEEGTFFVDERWRNPNRYRETHDPSIIELVNNPDRYTEGFSIGDQVFMFDVDREKTNISIHSYLDYESNGGSQDEFPLVPLVLPDKLINEIRGGKTYQLGYDRSHIVNLMAKIINASLDYALKNPSDPRKTVLNMGING